MTISTMMSRSTILVKNLNEIIVTGGLKILVTIYPCESEWGDDNRSNEERAYL